MEYIKLAGIVMGATGFWQLVGALLYWRNEKRLKSATANNLIAQTDAQILKNWIDWSQKLEQRVKELESMVKHLREENHRLEKRLATLQNDGLDEE